MAKGERRQIQGLDQGWVWEYKDVEWTTSQGKKSTARHAVNYLSGETLSTKQVRNIQREGQGLPITPKPKGNQRSGVIYSRTRETERRGMTASWSFRTLYEAQQFVLLGGIPNNYAGATIQTKFKSSRIPGKEYPRKKGSRYATLSPFLSRRGWTRQTRWNDIFEKSEEYNYDKNSRFYVFAVER